MSDTSDSNIPKSQDSQDNKGIEPGKRVVALIIDLVASYLFATLATLIPFLGRFLQLQIIILLFFLIRDFLFEGRGIGKNLMGLQVVDAASDSPPTLLQSVIRNLILILPLVLLEIAALILKFNPVVQLNSVISDALSLISTVYFIIVLPLESYRAYSRPDGLRKGDELAKTKVIESQMDFSHFLPRARN